MNAENCGDAPGKRVLLKVGGRKHLGEGRWIGALREFDELYVACIYREDTWSVEDDRVHIIELPKKQINFLLTGILLKTRFKRGLRWINWLIIWALRCFNPKWMAAVRAASPDLALCSYGDYDRSDLTYLIAKPAIGCKTVRSYKETRLGYNFLEHETFRAIDNISLYDIELKRFIEKKYPGVFEDKNLLLGQDENALPECVLSEIDYQPKLSAQDGRRHIAILSYRVDSTTDRERDQGRYYYVNTIHKLVGAGLCVHLHCAQYNNAADGTNKYEALKARYPDMFFMEKPLNMKRDSSKEEWAEACGVLSRYDFGLLHNIQEHSTVSAFDRINVPHRLFAYEAAHIAPIIEEGGNAVLERMFGELRCGVVFRDISELKAVPLSDIRYYTPTYEDYLRKIASM